MTLGDPPGQRAPGSGSLDASRVLAPGATLIAAARLIPATGPEVFAPGYVAFSGGRVTQVGAGQPPRRPDIELPDGVLVPGLVDLQVNGYFGEELMTADAAGWEMITGRLPETGTTAFLPTFITAPLPDLCQALRRAATWIPGAGDTGAASSGARGPGARILGVHLEGPFISPDRRGAHDPAWITDPTTAAVDELLAAAAGLLRVVTLAPERPGAIAAIGQFAGAGVLVSVGHSDATGRQVREAADHGARLVTHLFDAQRPLHHREPGVVGMALADARLTSGLIADLQHVCAEACAIAFAAAPGRVYLVTDAAACAGMPPGRYLLGGEPIELSGPPGQAPVRADGTLAGSALRMDKAVANMVYAGIGLTEAVMAATRVPAEVVGRPDLGRIEIGSAADLVWLGEDLITRGSWIRGQRAYFRP
ncbi:MAG: N-acetylglucosamine-6-phosphate deacetylase [Streptosporangiaceae bacterium]